MKVNIFKEVLIPFLMVIVTAMDTIDDSLEGRD